MDVFSLGHNRIMGRIQGTLNKAYKEGRLVFPPDDENGVEYTDKEGETRKFSLDVCAGFFWDKFSNQMMGGTGMALANLTTVNISPDDIKSVLLDLRGKSKKEKNSG